MTAPAKIAPVDMRQVADGAEEVQRMIVQAEALAQALADAYQDAARDPANARRFHALLGLLADHLADAVDTGEAFAEAVDALAAGKAVQP